MKEVHAIPVAVDNGDTEQHFPTYSWKRQNKINAKATEIATLKAELNKAL